MKATKLDTNKILLFWKNRESEWIQYHKLRDDIKDLLQKLNKPIKRRYVKEISDRTIMRYLDGLVKSGKLEKRIASDHHTFYKPKDFMSLQKEVLKDWIDIADITEVIDYLQLLTFQLTLIMKEKKENGESLTIKNLVEEVNSKILKELGFEEAINETIESETKLPLSTSKMI